MTDTVYPDWLQRAHAYVRLLAPKQKAIAWFSCGAASAIATVLAAEKYDIEAVYCKVVEEHPDNLKFIEEFTRATGIPVTIIMNERYEGSIYKVFEHRRFLKGPHGAQCTGLLKKQVRKDYKPRGEYQYDWIHVFGYTVDEQHRAQRFLEGNPEVTPDFLLIENGINKQECFTRLQALGLELPAMYKLGYTNNNCIGCVKGGMGYWNKIRKDFPDTFLRMSLMEREIGHSINKDKNGPIYLDELDPDRGVLKDDTPGDCGFNCEAR